MATPTSLPATFVAGNVLTAAQMNGLRGAFRVLQVVQATVATRVTTTSSTFVTTGLSASITPSATSSKILVTVASSGGTLNAIGAAYFTIFRGTVAGTNLFGSFGNSTAYSAGGEVAVGVSLSFLDSPSTTSAQTYTAGIKVDAGGTGFANTPNGSTAVMTLMEISA